MDKVNAPIGVFDSGVGGLTVVKEINRQLPNEEIIYFGDTARVPYGGKSKETIIRYSRQITNFLSQNNVKAIVVACNTASALALDTIEAEIDVPIIGVVRPGATTAYNTTRNKKIGVIATEATIGSKIYSQYINSFDKEIKVFGKACPLFVPLVEEGWLKDDVTKQVAERYLGELKKEGVDTLILGCTHYPLLKSVIGQVMGDEVTLVNPAFETARSLKQLLEEKGLLKKEACDANYKYEMYVSDLAEKFGTFAENILPEKIAFAKHVNIEEY